MTSSADSRKRHALGQHMLISSKVALQMVELSGLKPSDRVLEIGGGTGVLTEQIARIAGHVVSYEIDRSLFEIARRRVSFLPNVRVVHGDAFSLSRYELFDSLLSSLPYSRSLEFIEYLAERAQAFRTAVVLVQKEFTEKLLATVGSRNYRAVSVICQSLFSVEKLANVGRDSFEPPPSVLSSLIRFSPRVDSLLPRLDSSQIALIQSIFSFRGRLLRGAFRKLDKLKSFAKKVDETLLVTRVERIEPDDFLRVLKVLAEL